MLIVYSLYYECFWRYWDRTLVLGLDDTFLHFFQSARVYFYPPQSGNMNLVTGII
jgi:hypothetical protein